MGYWEKVKVAEREVSRLWEDHVKKCKICCGKKPKTCRRFDAACRKIGALVREADKE